MSGRPTISFLSQ